MANLKEVRTRIQSVQNTQQITSAMKMVSAAKLRRAQDAIIRMRPYAKKLTEIQQKLLSTAVDNQLSIYAEQRLDERVLIIVETSNKGLCGAFNMNVIKKTMALIQEEYSNQYQNGTLDLMCVGKKGAEYLSKRSYNIVATHTDIFDALSFDNAVAIIEPCMKQFISKHYDKVVMVYNHFINPAMQEVTIEQLLPLLPSQKLKSTLKKTEQIDYIFQPAKEDILNELIPKALRVQFYKTLLDSYASEHGSRMTAMHKATDNAADLLKNLRLQYNKVRQSVITNEILEIVSGANALNG